MADTAVRATVTELPESRVRVEAEVPSSEVERSLDRAARQLGRDLRIPGFRKGKVPTPVVIQRIGRDAVLDEAVRGFLPQWYVDAVDAAGIAPVGEPSLEVRDQMIELGSGRLIPGFEDQLKGATAGDDVTVAVTFPDDYGAEHLAGQAAEFAVSVKEVKAKQLPELDDE